MINIGKKKKKTKTIEGWGLAGIWVMLYECAVAFPVGILKTIVRHACTEMPTWVSEKRVLDKDMNPNFLRLSFL
jgi:hypothetical protein